MQVIGDVAEHAGESRPSPLTACVRPLLHLPPREPRDVLPLQVQACRCVSVSGVVVVVLLLIVVVVVVVVAAVMVVLGCLRVTVSPVRPSFVSGRIFHLCGTACSLPFDVSFSVLFLLLPRCFFVF